MSLTSDQLYRFDIFTQVSPRGGPLIDCAIRGKSQENWKTRIGKLFSVPMFGLDFEGEGVEIRKI